MITTFETSDLVTNADVAIRVSGVLALLTAGKPLPSDSEDALKRGLALTEEAIAGSSILTGSACSHAFAGNLAPLCWATDGYLLEHEASASPPDYNEIERFLLSLTHTLRKLISQEGTTDRIHADLPDVQEAKRFFDSLTRVLTQRADLAIIKPSGPTKASCSA